MERILAHYRALCRPHEADQLARAIAWEQTVEVVESAVPWPSVRERMVGQVESVQHDGAAADMVISYNPELAVNQITPLYTLAYGNASFYQQIRLLDLRIPDALADAIGGPQYGIEGLRQICGVAERPLLCTALKPRGAGESHMADIAYRYAIGGGDIIKDDQNLAHTGLAAFQRHVSAVHQALERAADQTGRRCLYLPHITGAGAYWRAQLDFIAGLNIRGALFCPLALGLDYCKTAARDYNLITAYHPAFGGAYTVPATHGIAAATIYGTFFRLAGADISIFLGPGGRLSLSEEENRAIAHQLTRPLGQLQATMPAPAGGKTLALLPELMELHGPDSMLLVGGALLTADPDITAGTRLFMDKIRAHYPGRQTAQRPLHALADNSYVLKQTAPGRWSERDTGEYKTRHSSPAADFADVVRLPLVGNGLERTAFELRYFELAANGYTSLEQHIHTHTIIIVRGHCLLLRGAGKNQEAISLATMDIAYIDRNVTHQLRNNSTEPCGFFCLVDRIRDRPQSLAAATEAPTAEGGPMECELGDNK